MDILAVRALVALEMKAVDRTILTRLASDVVLINQVGHYIVSGGGKRLRPLLVVLAARACGYEGAHHIGLAAVIEFIHTATLLHDDVVDGSALRRNRETANARWGNEASVLVGDFLYSRAFEMMVETGSLRVMEILAHATNRIAEGEVLQLIHCRNPEADEGSYLEVIQRKTATLFEAGTRLGAVIAEQSSVTETALATYGDHLGKAFQMVDDALDYSASAEQLGKNIGDDLAEGKPTLPLIHAMQTGTPAQRSLLREAVKTGGREGIAEVLAIIADTQAIAYTLSLAQHESRLAVAALATLPDTPYRDALTAVADFAVSRNH
ncbi:all-trans-octaprenyl-diphosphate synthase [Gammaproteobacteria bacterium]